MPTTSTSRLAVLTAAVLAAAALTFQTGPAAADTTTVLSVPWFGQVHALDCEAASLQSMLAYVGISATQDQILAAMGDDARAGRYVNGALRWGNAYQGFVGSVNGSEYDLTGYGTFWPVVERVADQLGSGAVYQAGAGIAPSAVYSLVAGGRPVQTWVTYDWAAHARHDYLTFDGSAWIPWAGGVEHSVVVIGVSDTSVYVSDPDGGKGLPGHNYPRQYWISKSTFETAYAVYGQMAVAVGRVPDTPVARACGGEGSVSVSWNRPDSYGAPLTGFTVILQPAGTTVNLPPAARLTTFHGLSPGVSYTATVVASDLFGPSGGGASDSASPAAAAPLAQSYLNWYDAASPGVAADNLHLFTAAGAAAADGCATIAGIAVAPFHLAAGQEQVIAFPAGTIGGPVQVSTFAGGAPQVAQRVIYGQTFAETAAVAAADAATSLYLSWYDLRSPGFSADNVHVLNPGAAPADVTVAIPGCAAQSAPGLAPGAETYFSCAGGYGGPVLITATGPVLASQRVIYDGSFAEVPAQPAAGASAALALSWYDSVTPGFGADNVHVLNPGSQSASVTVAIPGCPAQTDAALAPGAETFFACSGGYGGPVLVTSKGGPVLASQRVLYQGSFEESPAVSLGTAASTWQFSWYDAVSPGFGADNLHVLNAGSGATSITAAIPGCSPETAAAVQPGAEAVFACGRGYGGPVSVTSPGSVLAWQRVMYYRSIGDVPGVT